MKNIILISSALLILSSCTWGGQSPTQNTTPSYPTTSINATGVSLPPIDPNAPGEKFQAKWIKPTWSADISTTGVILSRTNNSGTTTLKPYDTRQTANNNTISIKDARWEFFVTLTKWSCSDGISMTQYPYSVTVLVESETLRGCATDIVKY